MQRLVLAILFLFSPLLAIEWDVRGQVSLWNTSTLDELEKTRIGLRYIPEVSTSHVFANGQMLDVDISFNTYAQRDFGAGQNETSLSLYRAWLRYSGAQFEVRLGLQQIKFGPAIILRPLMWFDQLDPRDPLQFTRGVPAALFRYYFLNNANVWLWGVLGDDETKGLETIPSKKNTGEYGGRLQYPLGPGELGFTYHHRNADLQPFLGKWSHMIPAIYQFNLGPIPENRYAMDGKWDIGIGIWFESVLVHKEIDYFQLDYQKYLTIGADYTFSLGSGLYLAGEHLMFDLSGELTQTGNTTELSALMASYNLSLWDMVMGLFTYSWETQELFSFFTWRRTFDNFCFNTSFFWNPETDLVGVGGSNSAFGSGKGFQIMVIYNH